MSGVGCLRTTATARRNARQHYVKSKRNLIGSVQLLTLTIGVLVVHQLSRPMDREGLQPRARIAGFGRGPVWRGREAIQTTRFRPFLDQMSES